MSTKNKVHRIDLNPISALVLDTIRTDIDLFAAPYDAAGDRVSWSLAEVLELYDDVVLDGSRDRKAVKAYRAVNMAIDNIAAGLFMVAFGDYYKTVPAGYEVDLAEQMYLTLCQEIVKDKCVAVGQDYRRPPDIELYVDDPLTESLLCLGLSYFDDAYSVAQEFVYSLDKNPWLLYELRHVRNQIIVKFGKDLRHIIFEESHGDERWNGELYMFDGTKATDVFINRINKSNNLGRKFSTRIRKL